MKSDKKKSESCKIILPGDKVYSCSARKIIILGIIIILAAVCFAGYFGYHLYEMSSEQKEFTEYKLYKKEKHEALEKLVNDNEKIVRDIAELSNIENRLKRQLEAYASSFNSTSVMQIESVMEKYEKKYDKFSISGKQLKSVINTKSNEIDKEISERKLALAEILKTVELITGDENYFPNLYPVKNGYITSGYGMRFAPIGGRSQWHPGIDISVKYGAPVYASAAGIVEKSEYNGSYGKYIKINHENGYETAYGHMSSLVVIEGEQVCKGQIIGYAGSSGYSTGPHVHYEVLLYGEFIDPGFVLKK